MMHGESPGHPQSPGWVGMVTSTLRCWSPQQCSPYARVFLEDSSLWVFFPSSFPGTYLLHHCPEDSEAHITGCFFSAFPPCLLSPVAAEVLLHPFPCSHCSTAPYRATTAVLANGMQDKSPGKPLEKSERKSPTCSSFSLQALTCQEVMLSVPSVICVLSRTLQTYYN